MTNPLNFNCDLNLTPSKVLFADQLKLNVVGKQIKRDFILLSKSQNVGRCALTLIASLAACWL